MMGEAKQGAEGTRVAFVCDRFAGLEEALVEEVRRLRRGDPLRPIDLLVGSNLLGVHLRRLLTRRLGAVAAVTPMTFLDLARRRCEDSLVAKGLSLLPPLGGDRILARALRRGAGGEVFDDVRAFDGFRGALSSSIRDLKDAVWKPSDLRIAGARAGRSAASRRRLEAVADLYRDYEESLESGRFYDRSDLIAGAVGVAESGDAGNRGLERPDAVLLVYGFYDMTGLQWRLLAAESRLRPTRVFVLDGEGRGWEFAHALPRRLEAMGFALDPRRAGRRDPDALQGALERLFEASPRPLALTDAPTPERRPALEIIEAADEEHEAIEIARAVLDSIRDGIAPGEIAVLSRDAERPPRIARALERARIPCFLLEGPSLAGTRAGRAALHLMGIAAHDWTREEVLGFLSIADLGRALGGGRNSGSSGWDLVSTEARIASRREDWFAGLDRYIARTRSRVRRLESGIESAGSHVAPARSDPLAIARRRLSSASSLLGAIGAIGRAIDAWPSEGSWAETTRGFLGALRALLAPSEDRDRVEGALEPLADLAAIDRCGGRAEFLDAASRTLAESRSPQGRFETGVLVADLLACRGLTFRAVVLCGLTEGSFPVAAREEPLLPDEDRQSLGLSPGGVALPDKGNRYAEERLLFRIALDSARERWLLCWPRLARDGQNESLPSPFLSRLAGALGEAAGQGGIGGALGAGLRPRRAPPFESDPSRAAEPLEQALALAARLGPDRERDAPRLFGPTFPFLSRGLECEARRWGRSPFGPHDGWLSGPCASRAYALFAGDSLSPSRIEDYAECPRRTFFLRILGLQPLPDPERLASIEPIDRGILIHGILADFLGELARESGEPVRLSRYAEGELEARLRTVSERRFRVDEEAAIVGYPLLWEIEKERIHSELGRWLDFEIERAASEGFSPFAFEWIFGDSGRRREEPAAPPAVLSLPGGEQIRLRGRIDRIDLHEDGRRIRVVDYKSGSAPGESPAARISDGRSVQLAVYMMAAAATIGPRDDAPAEVVSAEALYLAGEPEPVALSSETLREREGDLARAVGTLLSSVRDGDFTADPRDARHCERCEFRSACGEERWALFVRKRADRRVQGRLALREKGIP